MKKPKDVIQSGVTAPAKQEAVSGFTSIACTDTEAAAPTVKERNVESGNEASKGPSKMTIQSEDLNTLLEFMRIKAPELNIRQNQLARIFFYFFVSSALLFFLIFDGIGTEAFNVVESLSVGVFGSINNPRAYVIVGATFSIFFFFSRFGYLYYQGTKHVESVHNIIGLLLPFEKAKDTYLLDLRNSVMHQCKSNYMVQSLIVFVYPKDESGNNSFNNGPLWDSGPFRAFIIKALMIVIVISVGYVITVAQIMMLMVFLSFINIPLCLLLLFSFTCYYGFYFELVVRNMRWGKGGRHWSEGWWLRTEVTHPVRNRGPLWLAAPSALIIALSIMTNLSLFMQQGKPPEVLDCRVTGEKLRNISWLAAAIMSPLFKEPTEKPQNESLPTEKRVKKCP